MREPSFELLAQRLLRWGIASKYVNRLRSELRDHYEDLERDALRTGNSPEAAAAEARRRLGAEEAIVDEFLRRPELRAWQNRSRLVSRSLGAVSSLCWLLQRILSYVESMLPAAGRFALASAGAVLLMAASAFLIQAVMYGGAPGASARIEPARGGPVSRAELVVLPPALVVETRSERGAPGGAIDNRAARPVERPTPNPQPQRPSYPASLDAWPPSPMLRIAAVAPEVAVAPPQFRLTDGDLLPIVRVAPVFPGYAAARGLEGYVVVEYTVTRAGAVADPVVVESSNAIFERAALEAVGKFRYRPRVVGGQPVAVEGVRTMMSFVLEV